MPKKVIILDNTGGNMKKMLITLCVTEFVLIMFLSGCGVAPRVNIKHDLSRLTDVKATIQIMKSKHYGSSKGQMFGGLIGRSIANSTADKSYLLRLDQGCKNEISKIIGDSSLFDVVDDIGEYDIKIDIRYDIAMISGLPGTRQIIALHIDWNVYDNAVEVASVTTIVQDDDGPEVYPNTQDPRYYESYTKLAKRSAEDFIDRIYGKIPHWGNEYIRTWF